jgi:anhydro-N-acetylmuramic acid kinase
VFEEGLATRDLMRTFYEHAAHQIAYAISEVKGDNVLISGGGAHNSFLISLINQKVSRNFIIPDKELVDMKEALIFAFLGVLRIRNEVNSLSSVTGASKDSVNGTIHLP